MNRLSMSICVFALVALAGCFGKTAHEHEAAPPPASKPSPIDGKVEEAPARPAEEAATCGGGTTGGADDSCLTTTAVDCAKFDPDNCESFDEPNKLIGRLEGGFGTFDRADGVAHLHTPTPHDEAHGIIESLTPEFHSAFRMKVPAKSGGFQLVNASMGDGTTGGGSEVSLSVDGSRLQMCTPTSNGAPICIDAGELGREVWHTFRFDLESGVLTAQLDCNPPVQTKFEFTHGPFMEAGVVLEYGIVHPSCDGADVFVDFAGVR